MDLRRETDVQLDCKVSSMYSTRKTVIIPDRLSSTITKALLSLGEGTTCITEDIVMISTGNSA